MVVVIVLVVAVVINIVAVVVASPWHYRLQIRQPASTSRVQPLQQSIKKQSTWNKQPWFVLVPIVLLVVSTITSSHFCAPLPLRCYASYY